MGTYNKSLVKIADLVSGKMTPQLGQLLVKGGFIIPQDLDFALEHQKYTNGPLGEILVQMGALQAEDLDQVLFIQTAAKQC